MMEMKERRGEMMKIVFHPHLFFFFSLGLTKKLYYLHSNLSYCLSIFRDFKIFYFKIWRMKQLGEEHITEDSKFLY